MCTISKEELFEESKEIVELNILKDKLENLFCRESPVFIVIKESLNEIFLSLNNLSNSQSFKVLTLKYYQASESIKALANKHFELINEEIYEAFISASDELELLGDFCASVSKIDKNLTETSSLETLKKWSELIELFVEVVNLDDERISLENLTNLEKLAQRIVEVTFITNRKETRKNRYKRSLNISARLILSKVENNKLINKSTKSWPLEVGKKSYQELLRESQKRIHMLDDLDPKTNEEAKKQSDTLEYLKKHLECR